MLPTLDEIRQHFGLDDWSDSDIVQEFSRVTGMEARRAAEAFDLKINEPGFMTALKQPFGAWAESAGEAAADFIPGISKGNALQNWGEDVQFQNPLAVQSLAEISEKPWETVKQGVGQGLGYTAQFLGQDLLGRALGGVGGAIVGGPAGAVAGAAAGGAIQRAVSVGGRALQAAGKVVGSKPALIAGAGLPSYSGIRAEQESDEWWDKLVALAGSGAVGTIEVAFGVQPRLAKMLAGATTPEAKQAALTAIQQEMLNTTPLRAGLKEGAKVIGGEALEEAAQTPIEQIAGYENPLEPKQLEETAFGTVMGGLGALPFGGAYGAQRYMQRAAMGPSGGSTGLETGEVLPPGTRQPITGEPGEQMVLPLGEPIGPANGEGQQLEFDFQPQRRDSFALTENTGLVEKGIVRTDSDGMVYIEPARSENIPEADADKVVTFDRSKVLSWEQAKALAHEMGVSSVDLASSLVSTVYEPQIRAMILAKARSLGYGAVSVNHEEFSEGGGEEIVLVGNNAAEIAPRIGPVGTPMEQQELPLGEGGGQLAFDLQPPPPAFGLTPPPSLATEPVEFPLKDVVGSLIATLRSKRDAMLGTLSQRGQQPLTKATWLPNNYSTGVPNERRQQAFAINPVDPNAIWGRASDVDLEGYIDAVDTLGNPVAPSGLGLKVKDVAAAVQPGTIVTQGFFKAREEVARKKAMGIPASSTEEEAAREEAQDYQVVMGLVKDLMRKYTPDGKLIVQYDKNSGGGYAQYIPGGPTGGNVGRITVGPLHSIKTTMTYVPHGTSRFDVLRRAYLAKYRASLIDTTAHEFGHYLFGYQFSRASPEVQNAILQEYEDWLKSLQHKTFGQMLKSAGATMVGLESFTSSHGLPANANVAAHGPWYWLNFDEFVARRTADFVMRRISLKQFSPLTSGFWRTLGYKLKHLFNNTLKPWAWEGSSLEYFLDSLSLTYRIAKLEQSYADVLSGNVPSIVDPSKLPESPTQPEVQKVMQLTSTEAVDTEIKSVKFRNWFGDGKVTNPDGTAKVVYHGTDAAEDFSTFGQFSHFGTQEQAHRRLYSKMGSVSDDVASEVPGRIMPVYINLKNPLIVEDADNSRAKDLIRTETPSRPYKGWLDPRFWAYELFRTTGKAEGWFPSDFASIKTSTFVRAFDKLVGRGFTEKQALIMLLQKRGYDGAQYTNKFEGPGTSYLTFSPLQVKSAIGNTGEYNPRNPSSIYSIRAVTDTQAPTTTNYFESLNRIFGTKLKAGELGKNQARFNWFMKAILTLPQIERENWTVPGVRPFVDAARRWWGTKGIWTAKWDAWVDSVRRSGYGKAELSKLWRFANEVTVLSDGLGRRLTPDELAAEARKVGGLDNGLMDLWKSGREMLTDALAKLEQLATARINATWNERIAQEKSIVARQEMIKARDEALKESEDDFRKMKNRDYWPLARFGTYAVHVKATVPMTFMGRDFTPGDTILFELFETEGEQLARKAELLRAHKGKVTVAADRVDESIYSFMGLPPTVLRTIEGEIMSAAQAYLTGDETVDADTLKMMQDQLNALRTAMLHFTPENAFKQRLLRRKGTRGFTDDGLRAMASLGQSFAGHIARSEHRGEMDEALKILDQHRKEVAISEDPTMAGEGNKLSDLLNYLRRSQRDMMNPGNDLANLRAAGFLWYLGAVPRAAVVQVMQPIFTTYPWLASRYGDTSAMSEMAKGYTLLRQMLKGKGANIGIHLEKALQDGIEAGILNQSLFTELAGLAEGSNMQRLLPGKFLKSQEAAGLIRKAGYYASYLFQKGEEVNRLVTFRAAYMLELRKLLGMEGATEGEIAAKMREIVGTPEGSQIYNLAYTAGRSATEMTQGEYARWARPELMRGKKSAIFLFKMYSQIMNYFAIRDPGKWRFLGIQLAIAGALGLPFAEDLLDILNAATQGELCKTGDIRNCVREYVQELGLNPELAMHGLARVATPWDLSGSMSLGRVVPTVEPLTAAMMPGGDIRDSALRVQSEALGALFSIPLNWTKAVSSGEERDIEQAMPTVVRDVYRTYRRAREGGERGRGGEMIADIDWGDPLDVVTHLAQAAGFRPAELATEQEMRWSQKEAAKYWGGRREAVVGQFYHLYKTEGTPDREALADVIEAIKAFNASVPYPEMAVSMAQLKKGLKVSLQRQKLGEAGVAPEKKYRRLYSEVAEGFAY